MTRPLYNSYKTRAGFTLIEILIGTMIYAALFAVMATVLLTAFDSRERSDERLAFARSVSRVGERLRKDLAHLLPPGGTFATEYIGEPNFLSGLRADRLAFFSGAGAARGDDPWGSAMYVEYELAESVAADGSPTGALIRSVEPNLLRSYDQAPRTEVILEGVASLLIEHYDGDGWVEAWDSNNEEDALPEAVRMRIEFLVDSRGVKPPPLDVVAPLLIEPAPELGAAEGEEGGG